MKRYTETTYATDDGRDLLHLKPSHAEMARNYHQWTAEELHELGEACLAAAEVLHSQAELHAVEDV